MRIASPIVVLLTLLGCSSALETEETASFAVQTGATMVRFADLDGCCDVLVGSPARGQVDVVTEAGGAWEEIGSFPAGRYQFRDVRVSSVGGRPALLVQNDDQEVTQLTNDLLDYHRLGDAIRVHEGPSIRAIATGDLDRDGIDELVVSQGDGMRVIDRLERALFADPGRPPEMDRDSIGDSIPAAAMAVGDINGDGVADLVALHAEDSSARIFDAPMFDRERSASYVDVDLPARGVAAISTECRERNTFALLEDGRVVRIGWGEYSDDLPIAGHASRIVSSGDGFVVVYNDGTEMTLHGPCGRFGDPVGISSRGVVDLSMTARDNGARRMALLKGDGQSVELYRVASPY